jgi:SulP family sulfate permease
MSQSARRLAFDPVEYLRALTPKLVTALREGYNLDRLRYDALAGLSVAILALPLSMAIAIGAGATPDKGLVTAVIGGLVISCLGGSRYQIGGPAAAFIVIIASLVHTHGYDGMLTATFLAGFVLVAAGLLRLGTYIKYVPGPVILGFTSGLGVVIALGQVKDFLGFNGEVPADFFEKLEALWAIRQTLNPSALLIGLGTLLALVVVRARYPRWPALLIAVVAASGWAWELPIETIGTRFGGIPTSLPAPALPDLSWSKTVAVLPSALTIAFLVGVESLLSAVAADTMAGSRHRSNAEIVAQGVANIASPLFGGLPATGVIARTGTNITAGGKTPVAGVLHALFVLLFMLLLAPLASYLALPCLAAVLVHTSWRLLDVKEVSSFLMRAPWDDRMVLLATLLLTILVDLNVAIAVGVVLASLLFMHRMAETRPLHFGLGRHFTEDAEDPYRTPAAVITRLLPDGVKVFQFQGPLFFGAASHVSEALRGVREWPRVLILRMRDVPLIDATAISALEELAGLARENDCRIIMAGLQPQPRAALHRYGFLRTHRILVASSSLMALEKAKSLLDKSIRLAALG